MSSFRDALAEYRRAHKCSLTSEDDQYLDRWLADDRAQQLWESCGEWPDLIKLVLYSWRISAIAETASSYLSETKPIIEEARNLLMDFMKVDPELSHRRLPSTLRKAADLIEDYQQGIISYSKLLSRISDSFGARLSRQDSNSTRRRSFFIALLSKSMRKKLGRWHDKDVAILADIAFPGQEIDPDHVRQTRRPTTRKARHRKRSGGFPA
jgi:hypothetical protein